VHYYPDHFNIGDHLIWLGNIFFTDILKTKINYAASSKDFSELMENKW